MKDVRCRSVRIKRLLDKNMQQMENIIDRLLVLMFGDQMGHGSQLKT